MNKVLGIIGGLGPAASVYFQNLLVNMTKADLDQDHLDYIVTSRASTPDRTLFLTGKSDESPLPYLIEDAKKLQAAGANVICMVCNTSHYFFDEVASSVDAHFVNMLEESVKLAISKGKKCIGLMTTTGTMKTELYPKTCEKHGIDYVVLDEAWQEKIMEIIYGEIKAGKECNMDFFHSIIDEYKRCGCDCVLLGCTELSTIYIDKGFDKDFFIDSSTALAKKCLELCGKEIKEGY